MVRENQVTVLMWSLAPDPVGTAGLCIRPPLRLSPPLTTGPLMYPGCFGSVKFRFDAEILLAQGLYPGTEAHAQFLLRGLPNVDVVNFVVSDVVRFTVWR